MNFLKLLTIVALASVLVGACNFAKPTEKTVVTKVPLQFDYDPPVEGIVKSNEVSLVLINPQYAESFQGSYEEPYNTFVKNMARDFEEMLTHRGYPHKGPYDVYDEMVYQDKKMTDLVLEVLVDYTFTGDYIKSQQKRNYSSGQYYTAYYADGNVNLAGKITMTLSEPFTHTKVWVKSIPLNHNSFYVKSTEMYMTPDIPESDAGVWNALVTNLDEVYKKALQTAWNHLEPEELLVKKAESEEIKEKSGFLNK